MQGLCILWGCATAMATAPVNSCGVGRSVKSGLHVPNEVEMAVTLVTTEVKTTQPTGLATPPRLVAASTMLHATWGRVQYAIWVLLGCGLYRHPRTGRGGVCTITRTVVGVWFAPSPAHGLCGSQYCHLSGCLDRTAHVLLQQLGSCIWGQATASM